MAKAVFCGPRRIIAGAFALGFRIDWQKDLGVFLLVMIELGFWRATFAILDKE